MAVTPEQTLARRVEAIRSDHVSGASALAREAVEVLQAAWRLGPSAVRVTAAGLCRAQPAMAPVWNAAMLALGADGAHRLGRLHEQMCRAPRSLSTVFTRMILAGRAVGPKTNPLSLATVSSSGSVRTCLGALKEQSELQLFCAEGRPVYEGRQMATSLVSAGVGVTLCTDAAIGAVITHAEPPVEAVLVGADAVAPGWFLNKCGTYALAATAISIGIPIYVVADRSSFIQPALSAALGSGDGPPDEVWDAAPPGVSIANPYFERVPAELVSAFVTDVGPIGAASVGEMCQTIGDPAQAERLLEVIRDC